jgi:hypothetical protein
VLEDERLPERLRTVRLPQMRAELAPEGTAASKVKRRGAEQGAFDFGPSMSSLSAVLTVGAAALALR